jgi:hypothetical protein
MLPSFCPEKTIYRKMVERFERSEKSGMSEKFEKLILK